jgi:hypothetical protein
MVAPKHRRLVEAALCLDRQSKRLRARTGLGRRRWRERHHPCRPARVLAEALRRRTSSASSTARTSASGFRVVSKSRSARALFTTASSSTAAASACARSTLAIDPAATAASSSAARPARPNSVLVPWSGAWSKVWSWCRSVPFGATILVSEVSVSRDFCSVHFCAEGGSHFENRRTRKGSRGSNPFSSAREKRTTRCRSAAPAPPACRAHRPC